MDREKKFTSLRSKYRELGRGFLRAEGNTRDFRERDVFLEAGFGREDRQGSKIYGILRTSALFQLQVGLFKPLARPTQIKLDQTLLYPAGSFYGIFKV